MDGGSFMDGRSRREREREREGERGERRERRDRKIEGGRKGGMKEEGKEGEKGENEGEREGPKNGNWTPCAPRWGDSSGIGQAWRNWRSRWRFNQRLEFNSRITLIPL